MLVRRAEGSTFGGSAKIESSGPSPPAGEPGRSQQIGRFEIRRRLGVGGFGTVYHAFDPLLDRDVALKVPHPDRIEHERDKARVLREAKAAARLHHPNIVPVYEAGTDGQHFYIVSALVEGETLEAKAERELPGCAEAARIVLRLAQALDHAHRLGIIHRDVKPQNVMLDAQGEPMLMDFGLARLVESESLLTREARSSARRPTCRRSRPGASRRRCVPPATSTAWGSCCTDCSAADRRLAGSRQPCCSRCSTRSRIGRERGAEIPRDLETICLKAMAKDPAHRYPSCQELAEDLRRWLADEPIRARRVRLHERAWRWSRRNPVLAALSATALLLLLLVALVANIGYLRTSAVLSKEAAARQEADSQRQRAQNALAKEAAQRRRADTEARRAEQSLTKEIAERQRADSEAKRAEEALKQETAERRRAHDMQGKAETALAKEAAEAAARRPTSTTIVSPCARECPRRKHGPCR